MVRRAKMVLGYVEGARIKDLSAELGEQQDLIIKWRDRFIEKGLVGLYRTPLQNAAAISVDKKPSIQALSRTAGYVTRHNGKFVRTVKAPTGATVPKTCLVLLWWPSARLSPGRPKRKNGQTS
jgi:hypothetical protein